MKALRSDLPATGETTMSEETIAVSGYHGERARSVEGERAVGLAACAIGAQGPNVDLQPPAVVLALDVNQVIARAAVLAVGRGRGRGDANHRHRPVGTGNAGDFAPVIVAVQDKLAADAADHRLEGGGIGQPLEAAFGRERWMVDQHDPAEPLALEVGQQTLGPGDLRLAQAARGEERRL